MNVATVERAARAAQRPAIDVAAAQVPHAAARLERFAAVHHAVVVEHRARARREAEAVREALPPEHRVQPAQRRVVVVEQGLRQVQVVLQALRHGQTRHAAVPVELDDAPVRAVVRELDLGRRLLGRQVGARPLDTVGPMSERYVPFQSARHVRTRASSALGGWLVAEFAGSG